ncbi:phage tail fiber protein [Cronobacter malonaticus]|uniref:phage tail fiber protein n=1 Tax=Cronobacter malonaticus TaxID=413503 RepID=UPI000CFCE427|nr:tail fiber domain-containing protein [Cronobacter malonaticus]
MWYREGTKSLVKGSDSVSGVGTNWAKTENGVLPGMILLGGKGEPYEIKSVESDTSLTLVEPYTGESVSDLPCRIITTYQGDISQFSARFAAQLQRMNIDSGVIRSWLTSGQEAQLLAEDGTNITLKSLRQIVTEHEDAMAWFTENQEAILNAAAQASAATSSATAALLSQKAALTSETNASKSEKAASASEGAAATSEMNATASEKNAAESESKASHFAEQSIAAASAAASSEVNAKSAEAAAGVSERNAADSELKSSKSAANAAESSAAAETRAAEADSSSVKANQSAITASEAENNALSAASKAAQAASNAAASEVAAKASEANASASEVASSSVAKEAAASAESAKISESNAAKSMAAAAHSESSASSAEMNAKKSEDSAKDAETAAATSYANASLAEAAAKQAQAKAESASDLATNKASDAAASEAKATSAAQRAEALAADMLDGNEPHSEILSSITSIGEASSADQMMYLAGQNKFALTPLTATMRDVLSKTSADDVLAAIGATKGATKAINPLPSGTVGWIKVANGYFPQDGSTMRIDLGGGSGFDLGSFEQCSAATVILRAGNGSPTGVMGVAYNYSNRSVLGVCTVDTGDNNYDIYLKFTARTNNTLLNIQVAGCRLNDMGVLSEAVASPPDGAYMGTIKSFIFADESGTVTSGGDIKLQGQGVFDKEVTADYTGSVMFVDQHGSKAAFYNDVTTSGTSEYHPLAKQRITNGGNSWAGSFGWLVNSMQWTLQLIDQTAQGQNFYWRTNGDFYAPGRLLPGDYSNFDTRYLGLSANAASASKLQIARKIAGKAFDGTSDLALNADDVGAVSAGLTATVSGEAGVAWNAKTGLYNAQRSGDSVAIAHFNMNTGSCPSFQLMAKYRNGGLFYRSSRDSSGFESEYEQFYTTNYKPSPADIGAYPTSGGTIGGQVIINANTEALILKRASASQALYIRGRSEDNSLRWYMGNGGADDVLTLHNYLLNTTLQLNGSEVYTNRNFKAGGTLTLIGNGESNAIVGSGTSDVFLNNTKSAKYLQLKDNGVLAYSDNAVYHQGFKPTPADIGALSSSGGQVSGPVVATNPDGFRIKYGSFGSFMRNDGANTYFLLTNSGDQEGSWNGLRPIYWSNTSGNVTMQHSVSIGGTLAVNNKITVPTQSNSWINMRTGTAVEGNAAVSNAAAAPIVRQEHADRHYILGGLGNSQFGIYMINKSRTANGTDAYAYLGSDGTWNCSGNGSFNDVYIRSDRRSKRNIKKINGALDKLERIDGVLYELQDINGYTQSAGLVAQQVQEVQPELVTSDIDHASQEERLRLNYNGVIGMLVEAVKELRCEVKELKEAMQ